MKPVGTCKVDKMGRFVIPKKLRDEMALRSGTELELYVKENCVILEKIENRCVFCKTTEELIKADKGLFVCTKCRKILGCIV